MSKLRPTVAVRSSSDTRARELVELVGARVHVDVTIPRTEIRGKLRLLSRSERFEVAADTRNLLGEHGFPVDATAVSALGAGEQWQYEIGAATLARAVRDPGNTSLALAPLEDWRDCDDDQIAALFEAYNDLALRLDPLGGELGKLTDADVASIVAAAKKKDLEILTSFGSRKLASFIASSDDPPSS